ncbi:MAG: trehalase family glycosidase, partial [Balneolaceae bacterium]
ESMLDNFVYQIETIGYIPNGNRTYFLGRSQPPFFGAMVNLYAQYTSMEEAAKYIPALQAEYDFWMDGKDQLSEENPSYRRVVIVNDFVLNRYHDDRIEPRPESYLEDVELAHGMSEERANKLYLDLRAACESGWDFSARWFEDGNDFTTIRTSEIAPIDLNSILYHTENVLAKLYEADGNETKAVEYQGLAQYRSDAINATFWNDDATMFMDVLWADGSFTDRISAASFYPMYFKAADMELGTAQVPLLLENLRKDGGILTSIDVSGQQWDSPNGWAPLQWIAYKGLDHYGFESEAETMAKDWLSVNYKVYSSTGKMMEKYNVADTTLLAGGGEYPTQDGFGWTNGIALGLDADVDKY